MQEADEQDTCRICSAPGEPDQPLFYPCKCSGTIRYIHQDCLTTWLAHSKKKTCDVCKHPYSFTKVYAADMPLRLPPLLLLRRLVQQCLFAILFALRAVVVGTVWLALLPWATVWTWRMYFTMGDSTAWWISDRPRPSSSNVDQTPFYNYRNFTPHDANYTSIFSQNATFVERTMSRPFWRAISADIFAGQIIASLIVLVFVAVFLLREWISQNARPGVFEDEELLPGNDEIPPLEPIEPPPVLPQPQPQPPALPPHATVNLLRDDAARYRARDTRRPRRVHAVRSSTGARRRDIGKGKGKDKASDDESAVDSDEDRPTSDRARRRRKLHSESEGAAEESAEEQKVSPSLRDIVGAAAIRRAEVAKTASASASENDGGKFEFTFRAPSQYTSRHPSPSGIRATSSSSSVWSSQANPSDGSINAGTSFSPSSAYNESTEVPISPSSSSSTLSSTASPQSGVSSLSPSLADKIFVPKLVTPSSPIRRPPMPSMTLSTPNVAGTSISASTPPLAVGPTRSGAQTPLASPSLATYRAPEELEEGPSRLAGYFDYEDLTEAELKKEQDVYFQTHANGVGLSPQNEVRQQGDDGATEEPEDGERDGKESEDGDSHSSYLLIDEEEEEEDDDDDGVADGLDPLGLDGDADWEDDDDEAEDNREGPRQRDQAVQQEPAAGPPALVDIPDINDDLEGNVEDDMEGAMEAIGMRGPFYGVIQNAALMVFVLDTAIGLGIWLPFTIGKSTALLSLDPHRFLQIIHLPIRAMRIVTDPVVDSIAFLVKRFALPPLFRMLRAVINFAFNSTLCVIAKIAGKSRADRASARLISIYVQALETMSHPSEWLYSHRIQSVPEEATSYGIGKFFDNNSALARWSEPYFAAFGKEVRLTVVRLQTTWIRLALGHGTTEKVFAVILGYTVVALLLALYLNILTVGNVKSAGRAVRSAVRQQLLVLKVAVFIVIELVLFPLGCGVMLDICSVWLFPEANLQSRAIFFMQAPLTALFYHWVAGTMFMYQFAILVAGCRGVMRPGAMWFIKDPQDQNFHPIRDILERPTLTQLRKLLVSALMYAIVVALGVGSVASLLFLGFSSILPLRWKTREPLSDVPVDLLFLHFVLPYTMHYFRPKKVVNQIVLIVWKQLAKQLRLTSYMFGDRHPMEEYTPQYTSWTASAMTLFGIHHPKTMHKNYDGVFRRVPACDGVVLPQDMRATAAVQADGLPIDQAAARLIELQDAEAEKAKRNVDADYTVVYIPPHFRYRILLFFAALWIGFAIFVASVFSLPILLGRSFFKLFIPRDVHDGYSFIAGFYLLWTCYIISKALDRMDKRRQREGHDGPRAEFSLFVIKRSLLWLAKISYMVLFLGLVIPTLISFVMDFYVILPIRLAVNPALQPRIRVVDTWALGLLYAKIAVQAHRLQRTTPVMRGLNNIANNGWTHPDPLKATKEVIGPVTGGLLALLLFPALVVWGLRQFLSLPIDGKFIFLHVYPGLFAVVGFGRSIVAGMALLSSWSQSIRDKEFLVEMRLRNLEPPEEKKEIEGTLELEGELTDN